MSRRTKSLDRLQVLILSGMTPSAASMLANGAPLNQARRAGLSNAISASVLSPPVFLPRVTALVQHALQEAGKVSANPAVLEILAIAIRKGLDSPEKVAFAHRSQSIRSRVVIHSSYAEQLPGRQDQLGADFETILRSIDAHLAFRGLPQVFPPGDAGG